MSVDPIARFRRWYREAERAGAPQPEAMALATAARSGAPSLRFVLLKEVDPSGFVFFTDGRSRKGRELRANPRAAATFYWSATGKQVRVEGRVRAVSADEADAYWQRRPRGSLLSASASRQSAPLRSRATLVARRSALDRRYRGEPVPRPPAWMGFRIVPRAIEFWIHRDDRLHHRELFTRSGHGTRWKVTLLQP
ncbi:MAG: pyridoxamine 5'-phosphate oxidase [Proteobacteria bacterium]|nr:pyridoxamine 5'-phosphate oxidase [Pseudomonadota bacterium]